VIPAENILFDVCGEDAEDLWGEVHGGFARLRVKAGGYRFKSRYILYSYRRRSPLASSLSSSRPLRRRSSRARSSLSSSPRLLVASLDRLRLLRSLLFRRLCPSSESASTRPSSPSPPPPPLRELDGDLDRRCRLCRRSFLCRLRRLRRRSSSESSSESSPRLPRLFLPPSSSSLFVLPLDDTGGGSPNASANAASSRAFTAANSSSARRRSPASLASPSPTFSLAYQNTSFPLHHLPVVAMTECPR